MEENSIGHEKIYPVINEVTQHKVDMHAYSPLLPSNNIEQIFQGYTTWSLHSEKFVINGFL